MERGQTDSSLCFCCVTVDIFTKDIEHPRLFVGNHDLLVVVCFGITHETE